MRDVKGPGEAMENFILPVILLNLTGFGCGSVMVWEGIFMV